MVLFLDSGVGGLIYLEEFRKRYPRVPCEYIADTGYFPYGERAPADVRDRVVALVEDRVSVRHRTGTLPYSAVVIACNTASVVALSTLRERFSLPFVGVVPAVKPAAALTRTGHIAVLATARTSRDPYTDDLVERFARFCGVTRLGLPRLVQAAETGICRDEDPVRAVIREDVADVLGPETDTVVLACTHFVRYRHLFERELGPERRVVDSLDGVIRRLEAILDLGHPKPAPAPTPAPGETAGTTLYHTGILPPHMSCLRHRYRPIHFVPPRVEAIPP